MLTFRFSIFLLAMLLTAGAWAQDAPVDLTQQFEQRYAAWLDWVATQPERALLIVGVPFRTLVELGPQAAPLFAQRMQQAKDARIAAAMAEALARVTLKTLDLSALPAEQRQDPAVRVAAYTKWWTDDRARTRQSFDQLYARWKALKAKGDFTFTREVVTTVYDNEAKTISSRRDYQKTELATVYDALRDMGVDLLPLIVDKLQAKDADLLPLFRDFARVNPRGATVDERAVWVVKWWETNKGRWLIPVN